MDVQQSFRDLEATFDAAHFDRSHPARPALWAIGAYVGDLEADLAIAEAAVAGCREEVVGLERRASEAERELVSAMAILERVVTLALSGVGRSEERVP